MNKQISEEEQDLLLEVCEHFDDEDTSVRERQILTWRRLKLFWEGFHRAWYSETAHDWRIWDDIENSDDGQQAAYDKPINVFRAYLESIIAALSVTVPPIKCFPDDADDTLDLATARTGDKIAQLIFRHNNAPLLWLHTLFVFMTEGMVACYSYPKKDEKYGTYDESDYSEETEERQVTKCPSCGYSIDEVAMAAQTNPNAEQVAADKPDEYMPYLEEEPSPDIMNSELGPEGLGSDMCPACGSIVQLDVSTETFVVTRLVGVTKNAKTRICLEAYGGLNVKVPNYARNQADCPYLIYSYEVHYAIAIEKYAHLHGKDSLTAKKIRGESGPNDPYEQWGRLSPQYQGEYPQNTVTLRHTWLRPCAFNVLKDQEKAEELKKKYAKGIKVVRVNDLFAEACPEALDDCWTLTYNPLADYVHHDPLGLLLVSIQEITNDIISLQIQTMEHGIGQTFADPGVLNFDGYRQMESVPGGIYEAVPKTGKSLGDAFHEIKTASLSPEVMPFAQNIQTLAQLVSGALPSLFGGALGGGGETASEYSMSRAQALQRLQNVWKILCAFWKEIFGKAIPMYMQEVKSDERDVQRDSDGNFINIFLKRAEMEGKIGKVELEANENLPLTWSQQKDVVMQLLQAANPEILAIIGAPENLPVIRSAIGLTDFYVPGEDDREKQYDEIKLLLNSTPIPTGNQDPMMGPTEMPSIEVDPDFDNHEIEFEIVRKWVISEAGRQAKMDNPDGYKNVLLHGKMHMMFMQQQAMAAPAEGAAPGESPNPQDQEAPITGEENVATT